MSEFDRMTDRCRKVIQLAQREASRRGATAVQPEHVLLGAAIEGQGVAAHVLGFLGVGVEQVVAELPWFSDSPSPMESLPLSDDATKVISVAMAEAHLLNHNYIGTEHLLLGVVKAGGAVPTMLANLGITADDVHRQVYNLLGHGPFDRPNPTDHS